MTTQQEFSGLQTSESLSPRILWMSKYEIGFTKIRNRGGFLVHSKQFSGNGFGETLDEALANLARKNNIKLWNE